MANFVTKNETVENTIMELLRYGVVGGIAFLVDFSVLFLFREFVFAGSTIGLYLATACGFIAGIIVNTVLSIRFVFLSATVLQKKRGKNLHDILLIIMVGLIGLLLTEVSMYIGTEILLQHYLVVKIFVTGMVLIWNYLGRKILIFS